MDITVEQQIPVEQPATFQWPSGAAPCTARVTVHQGRVTDLNAPCGQVLAEGLELVRGLTLPSNDDLYRVFDARLEPAGEPVAGHVRLLDASVGPVTWDGSLRTPPVELGTRCRATVSFTVDAASATVDPACPERLAPEIVAAVRVVQWRVSGQQPMQGVTFHAPVDFYWIADAARKNQGVVVVAFPKPRIREGNEAKLSMALQDAEVAQMIPFDRAARPHPQAVSLQAKLTVAADGAVETMSVTGCPTRCQKRVSTLIAQNLLFWPAFADGVPVASEHTLDIRLPLGP